MKHNRDIFVMRHGFKLSYESKDEWIHNTRYRENPFDTPLTHRGFEEAASNAPLIFGINYIYTSPLTRCLQTAIEIAKEKACKIRIEYGLLEALNWGPVIFKNGEFIWDTSAEMNDPYNKKSWKSMIDSKLMPDNLLEMYPNIIDMKYESIYGPNDVSLFEDTLTVSKRIVNVFEHITGIDPDNICLITHAQPLEIMTKYLGSQQEHKFYAGDSMWTGVLVHSDLRGNITAYQHGKKI